MISVKEKTSKILQSYIKSSLLGISEATVRRRLGILVWIGIVSVDKASKPYKYKVEKPELAESIDVGLPDPEDIAERIAIISE